jgi:hypothetical protein
MPAIGFHGGRLANRFFGNMIFSLLSEKYKVEVSYSREEELAEMGLTFYKQDPPEDPTKRDILVEITNDSIVEYIRGDYPTERVWFTGIAPDTYFQTPAICHLFKEVFSDPIRRAPLREKNPFQERYGKNNDVFVHIRLGDIHHLCPSIVYYDRALQNIVFEKGYISSDSPSHPLVRALIVKYKLQLVELAPHRTIQFANTCNHLVLSNGTFSWMMGFFAFDASTIQYPKIKTPWHGDIFVFPEWKEVDW